MDDYEFIPATDSQFNRPSKVCMGDSGCGAVVLDETKHREWHAKQLHNSHGHLTGGKVFH